MKRAMLEVVVSGAVVEPIDVERYIRCTLLAAMNDYQVGQQGQLRLAAAFAVAFAVNWGHLEQSVVALVAVG